jgi:hypothetical protein
MSITVTQGGYPHVSWSFGRVKKTNNTSNSQQQRKNENKKDETTYGLWHLGVEEEWLVLDCESVAVVVLALASKVGKELLHVLRSKQTTNKKQKKLRSGLGAGEESNHDNVNTSLDSRSQLQVTGSTSGREPHDVKNRTCMLLALPETIEAASAFSVTHLQARLSSSNKHKRTTARQTNASKWSVVMGEYTWATHAQTLGENEAK